MIVTGRIMPEQGVLQGWIYGAVKYALKIKNNSQFHIDKSKTCVKMIMVFKFGGRKDLCGQRTTPSSRMN
ncbi:MAG: hypothetical protein IKO52_14020 [Clostridia bacterium]|nr:hypothetical protein [Clostridia bacterium]